VVPSTVQNVNLKAIAFVVRICFFTLTKGDRSRERRPVDSTPQGEWRRRDAQPQAAPAASVPTPAATPKQSKSNPFGTARPVDQSDVLRRVEEKISAVKVSDPEAAATAPAEPKMTWKRREQSTGDAKEVIFSGGSTQKPRAFDALKNDDEIKGPWRRAQ
jgi:hypothetical protein